VYGKLFRAGVVEIENGYLHKAYKKVPSIRACKKVKALLIVFRNQSPMAMDPQEGNSNTPCFLIPPFQGEINLPA